MTAENNQMAAEQPARVERPYDVGCEPRNTIHSRGDAKLGLASDLLD